MCARLDEARTVVYLVDLNDRAGHSGVESLLTATERRRASSFRLAERGRQFVICRAAARTLLGIELGVTPLDVPIEESPCGRPVVPKATGWDFNTSHCCGVGVIALRSGGLVGVDVQLAPAGHTWHRVMRRICGPAELEAVAGEASEIGDQAYLERWVAKEALLKALGTGFSFDPARIECRRDPHGQLRASRDAAPVGEVVRLAAPTGFAAAVAVLDAIRRPVGAL